MNAPAGKAPEAARRIADMLCETAFWSSDGRTCNWMGAAIGVEQHHRLRALGPDLYGGLSGVAMFLAGAYIVFGAPRYQAACHAALQAACLQFAGGQPARSDLSLFEGRLGLYFAAGQIASMTGAASLVPLSDIARLVSEASLRAHALDVIGGNAGAVCALTRFEPIELRPQLSALALQLGEEILRHGQPSGRALAWPPAAASGFPIAQVPLCGLSHGVSGMAVAALRLFELSKRPEFLSAARGAFCYEDQMFDRACGSWPDLRSGGAGGAPAQAFDAWCHGAGGIAVARMSACQCDLEFGDHHRDVALLALERTVATLVERLDHADADDGLCHGTAGLAEICMAGAHLFQIPRYQAVAIRAADKIAGRYLDFGPISDWPGDIVNRPGLMLGCAGVGCALLRLSGYEQLPSVTTLFASAGHVAA
jgi:lantibiotic modifying enzyme